MPNVVNKKFDSGRYHSASRDSPMVRRRKNDKLTLQERALVFKALSHSTRLQIVERLADGEQCVCDLLTLFQVDMSTLSRHLSVLKNAGILNDEKRGKNVFYSLACPCILDVFECMDDAMRQDKCG